MVNRAPAARAVALSGVAVVRDGAALIEDVHWAVGAGERWVLLGPHRAG